MTRSQEIVVETEHIIAVKTIWAEMGKHHKNFIVETAAILMKDNKHLAVAVFLTMSFSPQKVGLRAILEMVNELEEF